MTDAERVLLADIESRLVHQAPELHQLLSGLPAEQARLARRRRRARWWSAAIAVAAAVALLVTGLALGIPELAFAALCPPGRLLAVRAVLAVRRPPYRRTATCRWPPRR